MDKEIVEIVIHGVTAGHDCYPAAMSDFAGSFYSPQSQNHTFFKAELLNLRGRAWSAYTLIVGKNFYNAESRPGSYLGLSLLISDCLCESFDEIFSELRSVFNTKILNNLVEKTATGYKFRVSSFLMSSDLLDAISKDLFDRLSITLQRTKLLIPRHIPHPSTIVLSTRDKMDNKKLSEILAKCGTIILDEDHPTREKIEAEKEAQRKLEEQRLEEERKREEMQRQHEEELRRQKAEEERRVKEKIAEIENQKQQFNSQINDLRKQIAKKSETIRNFNEEYQTLANYLKSFNDRLSTIEKDLLRNKLPKNQFGGQRLAPNDYDDNGRPPIEPPIHPMINWKKVVFCVGIFITVLVLFILILRSCGKSDASLPKEKLPKTLVTDNTPKKENYSSHSADIVTEESDLSDPELSATNDYDILNPKDFNKSNFRIDLEPSKIVTGEHVSIKLLGKKSLTPDIRNLYGSTPYKEFNLSISNGADIYKDKHGREIEYTFTKPGNYTLKWSYKGSTITRKITVSPSNITVFDQNEQADE